MSVVTISAIKADVGGYVGHGDVHPRAARPEPRAASGRPWPRACSSTGG